MAETRSSKSSILGHQIKYMRAIIDEGHVFISFLSSGAHFQNAGSSWVHLLDPITAVNISKLPAIATCVSCNLVD